MAYTDNKKRAGTTALKIKQTFFKAKFVTQYDP